MKRFRRFYLSVLIGIFLGGALVAGCAHKLETGGPYAPVGQQPDPAFFVTDSAFCLAYGAMDGAFKFERENEAALWKISPKVKTALDKLRPQAWDWSTRYAKARAVYLANPTPEGLSPLNLALAEIQKLSASAIAAMPANSK